MGKLGTPSSAQAAVPHRVWQSWLPAAGQAAGLARKATREVLGWWQLAGLEDTAVLLVSELVTNSVRHAEHGGVLALRLESSGNGLRIEVHDADRRWPQPATPGGLDESGFGFMLVDELASAWGVRDTFAGKAVWAELGYGSRMPGPHAGRDFAAGESAGPSSPGREDPVSRSGTTRPRSPW